MPAWDRLLASAPAKVPLCVARARTGAVKPTPLRQALEEPLGETEEPSKPTAWEDWDVG